MPLPSELSRRQFAGASAAALFLRAPGIRVPGPEVTCGVASGDVSSERAVVWSRSDRAAKMVVEWSTDERFNATTRIVGPWTRQEDDFTAKLVLSDLPPGRPIWYRVRFRDPDAAGVLGEPVTGRFVTAPKERAPVRFVWGGDVAGQGWGIDPARGGMATFSAMKDAMPDFFLHSGDHIYADNPIGPGGVFADGSTWKNLQTAEVAKVAETLDEFRGRYRYNFLDRPYREFAASTSTLAQWDDHEVLNNWYPGERLDGDPRYRVKDVDVLAKRARLAFFEYAPILAEAADPLRIYRRVSYGPNLDVFLLDQRTYRGPNSPNRQPKAGPETAFLGTEQMNWLKTSLARSKATWKVIASDMPLGLVVADGADAYEAVANGDAGPPLGRELELAELLRSMKSDGVKNVVWLTADVHYAAAHHYDPARAKFSEFDPFWEFVAGPLHAGTFGPGVLDPTFGPEVRFNAIPEGTPQGLSPAAGLQFFGQVAIDGKGERMTVSLHDRAGKKRYGIDLAAL